MKNATNHTISAPHPCLTEELGFLIQKERIKAGLSLKEVCEYLTDVSVETLKLYESGRKSIPLKNIYALSNFLNIPPQTIMKYTGPSK